SIRLADESPGALRALHPLHSVAAGAASAREGDPARSSARMDGDPGISGGACHILSRSVESAAKEGRIAMSGDRAAILGRVKEALRVPAPHHHETTARAQSAGGATAPFREWLPPVGETEADRITIFARLSEMLRTEF